MCWTDAIATLHTLFSRLNITAPPPPPSPRLEIIYPADSQSQPSDPPRTCEILSRPLCTYNLIRQSWFSDAEIMAGVTEAAISYRSSPIWARARVLKHDHSFLSNARDESSLTPFSQACWGSQTSRWSCLSMAPILMSVGSGTCRILLWLWSVSRWGSWLTEEPWRM